MSRSATLSIVILAAGKGTRMKSSKAKVLHEVFGSPMVHHVVRATLPLKAEQTIAVIGHQRQAVEDSLSDFALSPVVQEEQLGTGHAVQIIEPYLNATAETIMILCGDTPLVRTETLQEMYTSHVNQGAVLTVMTTFLDNPTNYGRIIGNADNRVLEIIEEKDASEEQRKIKEINAGIYCVNKSFLFAALDEVGNDNSQGEIYLTDIVEIANRRNIAAHKFATSHASDVLGVNSRVELAEAHAELQRRRNIELMFQGITMIAPDSISVSSDCTIARDCLLMHGVQISHGTTMGMNCRIHPGTLLRNCTIGDNVEIGAYTVLNNENIPDNTILSPFTTCL